MARVGANARFTLLLEPGPAEAVYKLNEFMQEAAGIDRFVTLNACLLDPKAHEMTIVNAGHMSPLIYRQGRAALEEGISRDLTGFPLGVADGIPYESATISLNPGDAVFLFTDGVTDAKDKQEKQFQMEGVRGILSETAGVMSPKTAG